MLLWCYKLHLAQSCFFVIQGNMSISVCHGGDPIPKSPFTITVAPPLDLNKVKVQGLNTSKSIQVKSSGYLFICGMK